MTQQAFFSTTEEISSVYTKYSKKIGETLVKPSGIFLNSAN